MQLVVGELWAEDEQADQTEHMNEQWISAVLSVKDLPMHHTFGTASEP